MAKKISELTDGGALQATDEIPVARAGSTVRIAGSQFGGSLPAEWTVTSGALATAPTDDTVAALLEVTAPTGFEDNSSDGQLMRLVAEDGTVVGYVDTYGDILFAAPTGQGDPNLVLSSVDNPTHTVNLRPGASLIRGTAANLSILDGMAGVAIGTTGVRIKLVNAAPADGTIVAGEVVLWFDSTNGAAALGIKGKSANGTVVSGSVPLT